MFDDISGRRRGGVAEENSPAERDRAEVSGGFCPDPAFRALPRRGGQQTGGERVCHRHECIDVPHPGASDRPSAGGEVGSSNKRGKGRHGPGASQP